MKNTVEYDKCKDKGPEDTVSKLQNILHDAGIEVTYYWTNNEELECYSNRVQVTGTAIGANGKGTSRIYALASGYAELLERLQNSAVYSGALNPAFLEETGMVYAPDERFEKASVLALSDNSLMESFFKVNACGNDLEKLVCINKWSGNHPVEGKGEDKLLTVPFVSLRERKITHIPPAIYTKMYGTNGMCAGNTPEEALVQGMAEIFERHVNGYLLNHPVTPPDIPDKYLKEYPSLWERIQKIEKTGRYKVIIKDCSLAKGYPVAAAIIVNKEKCTFGLRIASHYSFPVALERTLTEALQGRDLELFTGSNSIGPEALCTYKENIGNIFKCGIGSYRKELLLDKPSYEFTPWKEINTANAEMLKSMTKQLLDEGYDILIRDVSFMGFPSYQIIVPGFSEIYPADDYKIKEVNTTKKISANLNNINDAAVEDIDRIRRLLTYKQSAIFDTSLSGILKRPFNNRAPGGTAQDEFLLSACYYRLGRLEEAGQVMKAIAERAAARNDQNSLYYHAIGILFQLKYENTPGDCIGEILEKLTDPEPAGKTCSLWLEPELVFRKLYPKFNCWDCGNCHAAYMCDYIKTEETLRSLRRIYKNNIPDQNELLKTL